MFAQTRNTPPAQKPGRKAPTSKQRGTPSCRVGMSAENKSVRSTGDLGDDVGPRGAWGVPDQPRLRVSCPPPPPRASPRLHKLFFVCSERAKPPPSQTVPSLAVFL